VQTECKGKRVPKTSSGYEAGDIGNPNEGI